MRTTGIAACGICSLVAILASGCASPPGATDRGSELSHTVVPVGTANANDPHRVQAQPGVEPRQRLNVVLSASAMNADEWRDLQAQPAAEQRRRLDVVLASNPDDFGARLLRTQLEYIQADEAGVAADSELVLASPSLDLPMRRQILAWRAEALLGLHRFDEAIAVSNQALEIDASVPDVLFTRGWAQFFNDQSDGALADLDRALELNPKEGVGFARRATVLSERSQFVSAVKDFKRAVELAPSDGFTHQSYGILLYRTRDLDGALAQFEVALKLNPGDPLTLAWHAQTNFALKRFDASAADERCLSSLGASSKDLTGAINNVAVDLFQQGDYSSAAREFSRSVALQANPDVAALLVRVQWYSGEFAQATETYHKYAVSPVSSDYTPIWLYTMRGRANPADEPAAKAELAASVRMHQPHAWSDTLVDLALGNATVEAALAEADSADTEKLRAGRRCEADYYAGEQLLIQGQDLTAERLLEQASKICPSTYHESHALAAERQLLAVRLPAH